MKTHRDFEAYSFIMKQDGKYENDEINKALLKLQNAFPNLTVDFFKLLKERTKQYNISAKKFDHAIDKTIDNYPYGSPPIAIILAYCDLQRVYSYADLIKNNADFKDYTVKDFNNSKYYVKKQINN